MSKFFVSNDRIQTDMYSLRIIFPFDWRLMGLSVAVFLIGGIDCDLFDNPNISDRGRFTNVCAAIDHLRNLLPVQISTEEKCKRYAVLLSEIGVVSAPHESTVLYTMLLNVSSLEELYRQIDISNLTLSYMSAIDKYRVIGLGPPFIDLIECLRILDTPLTKQYLDNQELIIILNLYKQVLGIPGTNDISGIDFSVFHPGFRATLWNLLGRYVDLGHLGDNTIAPLKTHVGRPMLREVQNVVSADPSGFGEMQKQDRKRMLNRERQRRYRARHPIRLRERSRQARQRQKMLDPITMRENDRLYKQNGRTRRASKLKVRKQLEYLTQRSEHQSSLPHGHSIDQNLAQEISDLEPLDLRIFDSPREFLPFLSTPGAGSPFEPTLEIDQRVQNQTIDNLIRSQLAETQDTPSQDCRLTSKSIIDSGSRGKHDEFDNPTFSMPPLEPASQGEPRLNQHDSINGAGPSDDRQSYLQYLLDEPRTTEGQ